MAVAAAGVLIPAGLARSADAQQVGARAATPAAIAPAHGTITTVAGGPGGPGPARGVSVSPCALKFARGGLYIGSDVGVHPAVYRVSQSGGRLVPVAGSGAGVLPGLGGAADGVPASAVTLNGTCGVTVDRAGNVLLADIQRVLVVAARSGRFYGTSMTAGRVYPVASGFSDAVDVELDAAGNLVVTNAGSQSTHTNPEIDSLVQVVAERSGTFYGQRMVTGKTYVIGGTAQGYTLGNGVPATRADLGSSIGTLRLDSAGNVVLAASGGGLFGGGPGQNGPGVAPEVRVIAGRAGTYYGRRMRAGYIYTIAGGGASKADGVPGTAALLNFAAAVALDAAGNVLIADGRVRVLAKRSGTFYRRKLTAGRIYTIAGPADAASVEVDSAGNVLVAGSASVSLHPFRVSIVAEKTGSYYGRKVRAGAVYPVAGNDRYGYSGDGGPATRAQMYFLAGVTQDRSDQVIAIAVDAIPTGVVRAVAGTTGVFFGRKMTAGDIYAIAAGRDEPSGVAVGRAGDVLVADRMTHVVRVISNKTGGIRTIAGNGTSGHSGDGGPALQASLDGPSGVTADPAGNVFVVDNELPVESNWIREVPARSGTYFGQQMTAGDIYTIAGDGTWANAGDGGPATSAALEPLAIAVDRAGNLVIASTDRIRVVAARGGTYYGQQMTAGHIYTVAGGGSQTGDGTPALSASIRAADVSADATGNLLVSYVNTIWMVAETAGAYYGKKMKAGAVYTIAASDFNAEGPLGDGGPAARAAFFVDGIAVGTGDNLLVADGLTDRIRSVAR